MNPEIYIGLAFGYREVVAGLKKNGFTNLKSAYDLMKDYLNRENSEKNFNIKKDAFLDKYLYYSTLEGGRGGRLIFPWVTMAITERCTLKCKHCISLMPDYKNPRHYEYEKLEKTVCRFLENVDRVLEFQIIGGEPLLYPELPKLIEYISKSDKVDQITITTNSTFVPKNFPMLKNEKLHMILDDYGNLSKALNDLEKKCKELEIAYHIERMQRWEYTGPVLFRKNSKCDDAFFDKQFNSCFFKSCMAIIEGKLFRCQYGARLTLLEKIPCNEKDFVDIDKGEVSKLRKQLSDLLYRNNHLLSCEYCKGTNTSNENRVPVAEQV